MLTNSPLAPATEHLARDLREDLGARLLDQLHQTHDDAVAQRTRAMLVDLRAMLDALDPRRYPLVECLDQWNAALREQAQAGDLRYRAQLPAPAVDSRLTLSPLQRSNPQRILAEFMDNALRHAHPRTLWLAAKLDAGRLHLRCRHDGRNTLPQDWRAARGLRNQLLRARDLGSDLSLRAVEPDMIELSLSFAVGEALGAEDGQ